MSTPPVACDRRTSLAEAAQVMDRAGVGSVVVVDGDSGKVAGILTERDVLRASAAEGADRPGAGSPPGRDRVAAWMTADPEVLGPEEEASAAWRSLSSHHYRHLPVVENGILVGVVSIRDLVQLAQLRPAGEPAVEVPRGLEGLTVAETAIGDVRGEEGFYHYRQYSATGLAATRRYEDVWFLLFEGHLPDHDESVRFRAELAAHRTLPDDLARLLPMIAGAGGELDVLRSAVSILGSVLELRPIHDSSGTEVRHDALVLCAAVPTILAAVHRLRHGQRPIPARPDLGQAANYLWMLTGEEPDAAHTRAIEQYLVLTIDHGFNASTFTARVITSTGADLAAALCGAIGALSGPLHGGAPSRALAMLDEIGDPSNAEAWVRAAVENGDRIMGFGHRVYKTDDPRSLFLRDVALGLGGPLVDDAVAIERTVVDVLAELKPGRRLYTNVEFFAGVVMQSCGIPPEMFTPTFATSRSVGWAAHILEQAADNRLIRPSGRYVGPPPPQPVPPGD
jgi:citrate synthase